MKIKDPLKTELIYNSALDIVLKNGLAGLTMPSIGKATGLGMGTIYVYFKSKEELINSLFIHLKKIHSESIYSVINYNLPYIINMRNLFEKYLVTRHKHYKEHFFIDQCANSYYLNSESKKYLTAAYEPFFNLLNSGKKELILKELDNELLTAQIIGALNEIVNVVINKKIKTDQKFIDDMFTLCWDSIKR